MTVIDMYSRWVQCFPLKRRTKEAFIRVFLDGIVYVRGCATVSDGAPEFVSKLASTLMAR